MQTRTLGRTGLTLSALGFGCGAVGGLMVRGDPAEQQRAVAMAVEHGITYFDTAPSYGDGRSEQNLGRILAALKPDVRLGTKVRLRPEDKGRVARAIAEEIEASLQRLRRDQVDLFQLHNPITTTGSGEALTPETVINEVAPAFQVLRDQGKTSFLGITAVGETAALKQVIESGCFQTAQVAYNLLNPSAGGSLPPGLAGQDYGNLLAQMTAAGMGAIGIRVLAGGALSGTEVRHPNASLPPQPIGSGPDYAADLVRARRFAAIVQQVQAANLAEVAIRFALAQPALTTTLIGIATLEQFQAALAAAEKGPLPETAMSQIRELQDRAD